MNACRNDTQCTKVHCPYFHSDSQKRGQAPDGFRLQPKNRGAAFMTNDYLAEFIQNQAQWLLPQRRNIYHPSTAPFVNSDTFMRQPYYILHASLGYKDPTQFSYYLTGHVEEQLDYKQRPVSDQNKSKMPRTFSHNSQMNAGASVPFYPGKGKVISKPMMQQMNSYKDMNKRFPTSVSHGMLAGMNNQMNPNAYGPPPGLEKTIMSQNNLYRMPIEEVGGNWNHHPYQADMNYHNNHGYMHWAPNASQMMPSALQSQVHPSMTMKNKKMASMKGSMSTEFNYNFGSKLITEPEDRFGCGFLENDSDSDDNKTPVYSLDSKKFAPSGLKNVHEKDES